MIVVTVIGTSCCVLFFGSSVCSDSVIRLPQHTFAAEQIRRRHRAPARSSYRCLVSCRELARLFDSAVIGRLLCCRPWRRPPSATAHCRRSLTEPQRHRYCRRDRYQHVADSFSVQPSDYVWSCRRSRRVGPVRWHSSCSIPSWLSCRTAIVLRWTFRDPGPFRRLSWTDLLSRRLQHLARPCWRSARMPSSFVYSSNRMVFNSTIRLLLTGWVVR